MTPLEAARDLLGHLPAAHLARHLAALEKLQPAAARELVDAAAVPRPLEADVCAEAHKPFLRCAASAHGDAWRSPWSDKYQPAAPADAPGGTPHLRPLELLANVLFQAYAAAYYGPAAVASAYFWDVDSTAGFAGCIAVQHRIDAAAGGRAVESGEDDDSDDDDDDDAKPTIIEARWDCVHDVAAEERDPDDQLFRYTLASRVRVYVKGTQDAAFEFSGEVTHHEESERTSTSNETHLAAMGGLVQAAEGRLRLALGAIHWGKAQAVTRQLRSHTPRSARAAQAELSHVLAATLAEMRKHDAAA